MTNLAKQTVLKQLELSISLNDMPWHVIQDIAHAKIYDRKVLAWLDAVNMDINNE